MRKGCDTVVEGVGDGKKKCGRELGTERCSFMALISAAAMEETIAFKKGKFQCELSRRTCIKMLTVGSFKVITVLTTCIISLNMPPHYWNLL